MKDGLGFKVGDMVQYAAHASWENGGLGVITDISQDFHLGDGTIQITWLDDIEDFGWDEAIKDRSQWYDNVDFKEDIKMFAEAV